VHCTMCPRRSRIRRTCTGTGRSFLRGRHRPWVPTVVGPQPRCRGDRARICWHGRKCAGTSRPGHWTKRGRRRQAGPRAVHRPPPVAEDPFEKKKKTAPSGREELSPDQRCRYRRPSSPGRRKTGPSVQRDPDPLVAGLCRRFTDCCLRRLPPPRPGPLSIGFHSRAAVTGETRQVPSWPASSYRLPEPFILRGRRNRPVRPGRSRRLGKLGGVAGDQQVSRPGPVRLERRHR